MIEIPVWLFEAGILGVFVMATVPLGYWIGYRDRSRRAFMDGYRKGRKTKVIGPFDV